LQAAEPVPPSHFDRTVELVLGSESEPLDGFGPSQVVEHTLEFSGTLHLWTHPAAVDSYLRVEDAATSEVLGEDDDSGGGNRPWMLLTVEAGQELAVFVALKRHLEEDVAVELHLVACPESAGTRAAANHGRAQLAEAVQMKRTGERASAREPLASAVDELLAAEGSPYSAQIAMTLWDLGYAANDLGASALARRAWERVRDQRERTLAPDHPGLIDAWQNIAAKMIDMGELQAARELEEQVVAACERTLPDEDPHALLARGNLADTSRALGDLRGARELQEEVLATSERALGPDHEYVLSARGNLALTMREMGDLPGARSRGHVLLGGRSRARSPASRADPPGLRRATRDRPRSPDRQGQRRRGAVRSGRARAGRSAVRADARAVRAGPLRGPSGCCRTPS
jgi:hypothetical protein